MTRSRSWVLLWSIALLITALGVYAPLSPLQPTSSLDGSWQLGINQAAALHMAFGREVVFTFGPYAAILTQSFHPATDLLTMLGGLYLGLSFFLVAFLRFQRAAWPLQVCLLIALSTIFTQRDALLFIYPLLVGTSIAELSRKPRPLSALMLLGVMAAPLGLLPLIKQSMLIASLGIMLLSSAILIDARRWDLLATLLVTPFLATAAFWSFSGQPAGDLSRYFRSASDIIGGYPEAMALPGNPNPIIAYAITSIIITAVVAMGARQERPVTRVAVTMMFVFILFLAFKAGFIRHDQHALIAGTFMVLCSLVLAALYPSLLALPVLTWAAATMTIMLSTLPGEPARMVQQMGRTYTSLWTGFEQRVVKAGYLAQRFEKAMTRIRNEHPIPFLPGRSDIYTIDQAYLIAAGNDWAPRPVLQSYSAYTPALAEINRQHLVGASAPDNLLVSINTIDQRLPALEDGPSWREMLTRYVPVEQLQQMIVLRRRDNVASLEQASTPLSTSTHQLGNWVELDAPEGLVFARMRLTQILAGRLWSTLFKPSQLRVTLRLASGEERSFRLISGMAQSEFLLSPLVETSAEFGSLYGKGSELAVKQVTAIRVEDLGGPATWNRDYELDLMPATFGKRAGPLSPDIESLPSQGN